MQHIWYPRAHPGSLSLTLSLFSRLLFLLLIPLSFIYAVAFRCSKMWHRLWRCIKGHPRYPVPIVVVGNMTVGGTGKTPLVEALCFALVRQGFTPGIVSRGYGRKTQAPAVVLEDSWPEQVGDEALHLKRTTHLPMVVGADRHAAIQRLLTLHPGSIDVIILDDGLQHFALVPDITIAVIDGVRGFGNGRCLPAGPLREPDPKARLSEMDFVVINGEGDGAIPRAFGTQLQPVCFVSLNNAEEQLTVPAFVEKHRGRAVHAVAGIGHPEQFFQLLEDLGLTVQRHAFPDHHAFKATDLQFGDALPVVMTEKDAIKCRPRGRAFTAGGPCWVLRVQMKLDASFIEALSNRLRAVNGLERKNDD